MKTKKLLLALSAFLMIFAVSCKQEELVANAVLVSEKSLTFDAEDCVEQYVTVYSDGRWTVDVPDWIIVNPTSGEGNDNVTINVTNNIREGAIDNPREFDLIFRGLTTASEAHLLIKQDGDLFRGIVPSSFEDILQGENKTFYQIEKSQVVALASNGFVLCNGGKNIFVKSEEIVEIGDNVELYGFKYSFNKLTCLENIERFQSSGKTEVTYPEEKNVTAEFDDLSLSSMDYITIDGILQGKEILVNGATKMKCLIQNDHSSVGVASLNGHKVTAKVYYMGTVGSTTYVLPVSFVDKGLDKIIYLNENFDWLSQFDAAGMGDSMGRKADDGAINAYTIATGGFAEALAQHGYEDLYPDSKTFYLQKYYLKFSKTSYANGIKLPALKDIPDGKKVNVDMSFKWAPHTGGSGKIDMTKLVIEIVGNGTVATGAKACEPIEYKSAEPWEWQTENVVLFNVDKDTRIIIKPEHFLGTKDPAKTYYRWYLDDILITENEQGLTPPTPIDPSPEPEPEPEPEPQDPEIVYPELPAGVYFMDDFEWISNHDKEGVLTDAMTNKDSGSKTAKNIYTSIPSIGREYAARGYVDLLPGPQVTYALKNYLKFSKTDNTNGLKLPELSKISGIVDAKLEFDWAPHTGSSMDNVNLYVEIEGNGKFENGTTKSDLIQNCGESWKWMHQELVLKGIDNKTRIIIKPENFVGEPVSGQGLFRWYIDNIKVSAVESQKPEPEPEPGVTPLDVKWNLSEATMASYKDLFSSKKDLEAGDGGQYVPAAEGNGKLSYVQVEKKMAGGEKQSRVIGATGEPYVTAAWIGDYFLLEASGDVRPAGTEVNIKYGTKTSGTGPKYWVLEYLDGEEWIPAMPLTDVVLDGQTVSYNIMQDGKTTIDVAAKVSIKNATGHFAFRMRNLTSVQSSSGKPLTAPNGGTARICGANHSPRIWIE